jgi:tRNA modification GTPase
VTSVAAAIDGGTDTIVAVATPPGRSALALIRLSGPRAVVIAGAVVRPWPIEPRRATYVTVVDPATRETLDRPVLTVFPGPRSFTGEDVVEIITHGGSAVPAAVMAVLVAAGARPARPGEFSRRAVLNNKMDLAQAEAIGDLIDASSGAMRRAALSQLDGGLSRRVAELRSALLDVDALLAYDIDFPEEDDGPVPRARIARAAAAAATSIDRLLASAPVGELVRDGAVVVIAGAPNVGKSSLFNALVGRARALVTDIPGTTRDALEAVIEPAGGASRFPLRLVDTAGLRQTSDVVERLGIEVSERYLKGAHVVLACGDTPAAVDEATARAQAVSAAPIVGVRTKSDLDIYSSDDGVVAVSAERGTGLETLLAAIYAAVPGAVEPDIPLVTRERHRSALTTAAAELATFRTEWDAGQLPAVIAATHLRAAIGALDELIGAVRVDDILDRVFSQFCVGK